MDEHIKNLKLPTALKNELAKAKSKPSWESRNEGVHERINFDDTIWGFNLAGGAYYNTLLRVTEPEPNTQFIRRRSVKCSSNFFQSIAKGVKDGSRASNAGIKIGDLLMCINGIDTMTLTVQEAHDLILASGIEIKLSLAAPDVEETMYYVYQDEYVDELRDTRRLKKSKVHKELKPFTGAKVNNQWSNVWPCNKKRDILYRESNCFCVPSKYELKHL